MPSDPNVQIVTDDDGAQRWAAVVSAPEIPDAAPVEASAPDSPEADQPGEIVTKEAPDAPATDAPDGDRRNPSPAKRRP